MTQWPTKDEREDQEIKGFIHNYCRLEHGRNFEIVEKREKPDYLVRDIVTSELFGVELTSVYLSDRSVPDEHIPAMQRKGVTAGTDYDEEEIKRYETRVIEAVKSKVTKAREGYDNEYPIILSIYVNEYRAIFMDTNDWKIFVNKNEEIFDLIQPFVEIVFWSLANNDVLSVIPEEHG